MRHPVRSALFIFLSFATGSTAYSQIYLGAGYGTFNVPGASMKFRGDGPTFRFEYTKPDYKTSLFVDVSYFEKSVPEGTTQIYDNNGVPIGNASVTDKYSYIYNTVGGKFKFSDRKFSPYLGAGIAVVFARQQPSFQPSYNVSGSAQSMVTEGFHFDAGLQYDTGPVMLQLQGNLDIVLKVLVDDVSNVMTNLRFTILVPVLR
jgi:hypothetical protein